MVVLVEFDIKYFPLQFVGSYFSQPNSYLNFILLVRISQQENFLLWNKPFLPIFISYFLWLQKFKL